MKVLVHGLGTEGRAAVDFLRTRTDVDIATFDDAGHAIDGVQHLTSGKELSFLEGCHYLRSPGIPPTHQLVVAAAERAALATTPTGLWLCDHAPDTTITVTGTKGKSSTTSLLSALWQAAGVSSSAYGNIGRPPLSQPMPTDSHPVVEVSSFMMHDLPNTDHGHLITSLYTDHMDWHGTVDAYWQAKLRPFHKPSPNRGWAPRAVIADHGLPASVLAIEDLVQVRDGRLYVGGVSADIGPADLGFHAGPLSMALAAAAAAAHSGLSQTAIVSATEQVAAEWQGLPCRQEIVPSADDRLWVNDVLGTVPEATMAVLDRFAGREVHLVIGGADRGQSYERLSQYLKAADHVHAVGHGTAGLVLDGLAAWVPSFEEAIQRVAHAAPPGSVVLLSPAAPTAPPLKSYRDRADIFRAAAGGSLPDIS